MSMMKKIIYGLIAWLVPFLFSVAVWPLHETMLPLFKSVVLVFSVTLGVVLLVLYFRKVEGRYFRDGIILGLVWLAISLILDLAVLVYFMKMPLGMYLMDIGLRYLLMPVLSAGFGYIIAFKVQK
ncbi:MAG TPA: hypothetical protein VF857_03575 [Spirochaetota bacterium]